MKSQPTASTPWLGVRAGSGNLTRVRGGSIGGFGTFARTRAGTRVSHATFENMKRADARVGEVLGGRSSVNQAPITGESIPVAKAEGDLVFAGTVNERGSFEFRVTANKGHTTLDRIIRTVQEAQSQRAPTQRFVDRFAHYYTPGVVLFAVLVATVPPLFFRAPMGLRSPLLDPVLAGCGLRYVSWTRRGYDAVARDPDRILRRLADGLAAGDILLLHDKGNWRAPDGTPLALAVLPELLGRIRASGLKPVSLAAAASAP